MSTTAYDERDERDCWQLSLRDLAVGEPCVETTLALSCGESIVRGFYLWGHYDEACLPAGSYAFSEQYRTADGTEYSWSFRRRVSDP